MKSGKVEVSYTLKKGTPLQKDRGYVYGPTDGFNIRKDDLKKFIDSLGNEVESLTIKFYNEDDTSRIN